MNIDYRMAFPISEEGKTNTQMYKYAYKLIQNATSIIKECGGYSQ